MTNYTAPALTEAVVLTGGYSVPALTVPVVVGELVIVEGTLTASLPAVSVPFDFFAYERVYKSTLNVLLPAPTLLLSIPAYSTQAYTPPLLAQPIRLASAYNPPWLSLPVLLFESVYNPFALDLIPTVSIETDLMLSVPTLNLTASELPPRSADSLLAKLPLHRPGPLSLTAQIERIHSITIAAPLALAPPTFLLAFSAAIDQLFNAQMQADLALSLPLSIDMTITGDINLDKIDAEGPALAQRQQTASATATPVGLDQHTMQPAHTPLHALLATASPIVVSLQASNTSTLPANYRTDANHQRGIAIDSGTRQAWSEAIYTRCTRVQDHQYGIPIRTGSRAFWAETTKTRTVRQLTEQNALPVDNGLPLFEQTAWPTQTGLNSRWTHADWPLPGRWWPFYEVPLLTDFVIDCSGGYTPRPLRCQVVLDWYRRVQPQCPDLPDGGTIIIPVLQVYTVINSFELKRASDNTPIATRDFSASIDVNSWTWSFTATVPADALALLTPTAIDSPRELIATINGESLHLIAERLSRSRTFGESWLTVSGRGRAAWLADPYVAPETRSNDQSRTAQQLLNDALTLNGVGIGWGVTWGLTDWTVPAGAWNHTGTYIDAAKRIAEAGGGYVQAHDTDQTVIIKPYYPAAPWHWSSQTPDIALPEDVCTVEGIEWQDKARYNAVYVVGGTNGGRQDRVKITGSAADRMAQTVVDELATDVQMTRQRGIRVLGDTGRQAWIDLELPVLPETGLIHPGLFVDYTENGVTRRGLTRAVRINHKFPRLRQTITMETHESV